MIDSSPFQMKLAGQHLAGSKDDPMFKLRQKAWDAFADKGLPTKKTETYKYVKLRKLFELDFQAAKAEKRDVKEWIYPECEHSNIVFINGHFEPELSRLPEGVDIQPLSEAIFSFGTFLNNQWMKTVKEETDPFALLNSALFSEGALIYISPNTQLEKPLQLLFVTTEENGMATPRVELFLGKSSEAKLVSRHVGLNKSGLSNLFTNCHLEANAKLSYTQVATENQGWLFDATRAHLKKDARFETQMATAGSETTRFDYQIEVAGEGADCHLNGLWMLKETNEAHVHVLMKHSVPNTTSLQLFKGALDGASRSSFEGKIYVEKEAQKTDSYQMNNNLILSDNAQANSKPNLEIFADDVKASHGSTVGQLDPEELFYLRTRGYSEQEAKTILTKGFLREVLTKIPLASVREKVIRQSDNFL